MRALHFRFIVLLLFWHAESYRPVSLGQIQSTVEDTKDAVESMQGSFVQLLRDGAPRLWEDSELRKAMEAAVQRSISADVINKLETRMKFYPGMTSASQLLEWNAAVAGPRMGPVKSLPDMIQGPRVLSMHDMSSGYNSLSDNDYLMMFRSWDIVDIFVYFSHVNIAVPPLQWVMVAHQHNRPALGTIMLEGNSASTEFISMMSKNRSVLMNRLVQLADHYGFDGWFFNIETSGSWPHGDPENFVGEVRDKLKKSIGPRAQVIAYPYGPQDKMFNYADGVFVNYNWPTSSLVEVANSAGDRRSDVYMGMDSFGRLRGNNEPDPAHVKACSKHKLSIAVFAPGFTLEKVAKQNYSTAAVDFDERYWGSIGENFDRPVHKRVKSGDAWPLSWTAPKQDENKVVRELFPEYHSSSVGLSRDDFANLFSRSFDNTQAVEKTHEPSMKLPSPPSHML